MYIYIYIWLVVSIPLKNMKVSWDYYSQYNMETCSKPPNIYIYICIIYIYIILSYKLCIYYYYIIIYSPVLSPYISIMWMVYIVF